MTTMPVFDKNIYVIIRLPIPYYPVLVMYLFPFRHSFKDRKYQLPFAVGITNEAQGAGYTWFIDVDKPRLIRELLPKSILVVKTTKGYHYYLDILESTFIKAMKMAYRYHKTYGDMGQLRLALSRNNLMITRIYGKYFEPLEIIHERESQYTELENWKNHVIELILKLNSKG